MLRNARIGRENRQGECSGQTSDQPFFLQILGDGFNEVGDQLIHIALDDSFQLS